MMSLVAAVQALVNWQNETVHIIETLAIRVTRLEGQQSDEGTVPMGYKAVWACHATGNDGMSEWYLPPDGEANAYSVRILVPEDDK